MLYPRSFLGRTILIIILPMLLAQIVVYQAFRGNHWSRVQREMSRGLAGEIATIMKLADNGHPALAREMAADIGINLTENAKLNRPPQDDGHRREVGHLNEELKKKLNIPAKIYIEKSKRQLYIDLQKNDKIWTFATTLRRVYSSSTEMFLAWIFIAIFGTLILTAPFLIMHARSIRQIARAANKFGRGMALQGFAPSGSREIRDAGAALIAMKDRLDRYNRTRSDMLTAVSHDLKAPLSRMRLAVETDSADKAKMLSDVDRMAEMINGYLSFARGEVPEIEQKVSVAPIVERIIRDHGKAKQIDLRVPDEPADFYARPNALASVFANIIDNAVRHARKKIVVEEKDLAECVEITIDDDGPGIPADLRAEALRPFVRLDAGRRSSDGGSGLGLNIAQTAVENHGGEMFLEDSPLGGLRVRIVLPI